METTTYNTIVLTCHPMAHPDMSHISFTSPLPLAASTWVITLHYLLCNWTHPYPITLLLIGWGYFQAKPSPVWIPQQFSNLVILHLPAYEDGTECSKTSAYKICDTGELPRRKHTTYRTRESLKSSIPTLSVMLAALYVTAVF
jgi:hypothetical protein